MELIRGSGNVRERHQGCVVTIGTFDGLHRGHQALITRLKAHGARLARPTTLLTFEPMPREYFAPDDPPARLTSFRERWRVLERMELDYLWLLHFGEALRQLSGDEFMGLLAHKLKAAVIVVGHDFKFGRGGTADVRMLQDSAGRLGFEVDVVAPVMLDGERLSSSSIRDALAAGDFERAARALGRPYTMRGRVVQGAQLGRTLGFATANLHTERRRAPVAGIFAVRVHGITPDASLPAVASLGTRPTVNGTQPLLEVHVFDFAADLYGREIEVEFVAKLRDEAHFASIEAMTKQIRRDALEARRLLNS